MAEGAEVACVCFIWGDVEQVEVAREAVNVYEVMSTSTVKIVECHMIVGPLWGVQQAGAVPWAEMVC